MGCLYHLFWIGLDYFYTFANHSISKLDAFMKLLIVYYFLFFSSIIGAQNANEKLLHGKITAENALVGKIDVVNLVNEKATITNAEGDFYILAKAGDVLVLLSENLEYKREIISSEEFESELIFVQMKSKPIELEEVMINKSSEINSVSLGIISPNQKKYTAAERKLKTAGDFKPIQLLGILGGSLPVDPIINTISGRTEKLKKELAVEKREFYLNKINETYKSDYFINVLDIPLNYVKGFQYFIIEDKIFVDHLSTNNTTMIEFLMSELAIKYNKILACE